MKRILVLAILLYVAVPFAVCQEKAVEKKTEPAKPELTVELKIGSGFDLEKKEITGESDKFLSDVDKIWCWSFVKGAKTETYVTHEWWFNKKRLAEIKLDVKYPLHRTWSRKTIYSEWAGDWVVKVIDANGNVLAEKAFKIEKKAAEKPAEKPAENK